MKNTDQRLQSIVDRLVRLMEERRALSTDIREVFDQARSEGFDVPGLRIVVKRAVEDGEKRRKREEAEQHADIMLAALGMLSGTPLGVAALST